MKMYFNKTAAALGVASLASSSAYALTSGFSASLSFSQPFTIVQGVQMNFGSLISNTSSTYTLDTSDNVTGTGAGAVVGGTPATGTYTITDTGTANANVDISVQNLTANNGVTPANPVCNWAGVADIAGCVLNNVTNAAGGKVLAVGMDIQVDGTQNSGTSAAPTFEIVVTYD